jgi:hypothetical protein
MEFIEIKDAIVRLDQIAFATVASSRVELVLLGMSTPVTLHCTSNTAAKKLVADIQTKLKNLNKNP